MSLTVFFRKLIGWARFNSFERDYYFYFSMCWKFLAFIFYLKIPFHGGYFKMESGAHPTHAAWNVPKKKKKKGRDHNFKNIGNH